MSGKYSDLEKLRDLLAKGAITEAEYNIEKEKILKGDTSTYGHESQRDIKSRDNRTFNSLMHISQFSNFLFPFLGIIIPIVMWSTRKDEDKSVDMNGKIILNWNISACIYMFVLVLILIFAIFGIYGSEMISGIGTGGDDFAENNPGFILNLIGTFAIIVIPMLILSVLDFIFKIVGAIKATNDEIWNYPLSIRFFKTN